LPWILSVKRRHSGLPQIAILALLLFGAVAGWRIGGRSRGSGSIPAESATVASGDFFSQEFAPSAAIAPVGGLATGGLSDGLLKTYVWKSVLSYERAANCADVTSQAIDVAEINEVGEYWVEDWTVRACGKTQVFRMTFRPDPIGGTQYELSTK